jgi:NAD(P)H-quinone oxidoreductase subunit 5
MDATSQNLVTAVMLVLVTALGAVIARYASTYLEGDPGRPRALRWLGFTLVAVGTLIVTGDLLVLALAWTAVSVGIHQLLTFYPDRTAALVAAHKKFLVSRLADGFLWAAILLVVSEVGSTSLGELEAFVRSEPSPSLGLQLAAGAFVIAIALRSAQLPFHGWLTQVMEAPTPVSALLHAGVVNIGGFVMIRLSVLMSAVPWAQGLLLGIGLTTAVLAALVMTTRVSVKVALAWSTIAQMGFMLVQCGLGAWHLALLHLVAHSLYKAHAFLTAGSAVEAWKRRADAPRSALTARSLALALLTSALIVVSLVLATGSQGEGPLAVLVGLALVAFLQRGVSVRLIASSVMIAALVFALHLGAARVIGPLTTNAAGWWVVALVLSALFAAKAALQLAPGSAFARTLHPWLFCGLFLDETFTRLTFRWWPPRFARTDEDRALPLTTSAEA